MSLRRDDPSGEGTHASWGSPVDAYAEFRPYAGRVDLFLRTQAAGGSAVATEVDGRHFLYRTPEEEGSATPPVLDLDEAEARAIYAALDRIFGQREVEYADAEFLRSVYEREASRLDRMLFPPPVFESLQGPEEH